MGRTYVIQGGMKILLVALLLTSSACKKSAESGKEREVSSSVRSESVAISSSAAPAKRSAAYTDEQKCLEPCLRLATETIAPNVSPDFDWCSTCDGSNRSSCKVEHSDAWNVENAYLRNCIYASAGKVFKTKKWSSTFSKKSWYQPRPAFKESDIGKVGHENIARIKWRERAEGLKQPIRQVKNSENIDLDGDGSNEATTADFSREPRNREKHKHRGYQNFHHDS